MDLKRFREVLKQAREGETLRSGKLGRPALSKLTASTGPTPVNAQTIKNIEDGKNADPGVATISRIVEAMGLTLSSFFAQIEGLKAADKPVQTPGFPQSQDVDGGGASLSQSESERIGQILVTAGVAVARRGAGITVQPASRTVSASRRKKPTRIKARTKNG